MSKPQPKRGEQRRRGLRLGQEVGVRRRESGVDKDFGFGDL